MGNPLYQMMGNNDFMQQLRSFRQNFKGDPNDTIQQLLRSGRISQSQYNQAVQMAQNFQRFIK